MDNQEAAEMIRDDMKLHHDSLSGEYRKALNMAISALQEQDVSDINVGDMISSQESIDTNGLDEEVRCAMCRNQMKTDRGCDGNCKYDEKLYEKIMQILYERIKPLSPAQPEPSIPISWIEKQIDWLKSMDNYFSNLTAMNISVLVKKWRIENGKDE